MQIEAARAYAQRHKLQALIVSRGTDVVDEWYAPGWDAAKPHALYSGTKSFWGPTALAAQDDGLLTLDETVGETLPSWSHDPAKRHVTLRHLLTLTSGIGFGGLGSAVPSYEKAEAVELKNAPGEQFTYGGIPLQVFGAVFARKLAPRGLTPHAYLRDRILDPLGMHVGSWRTLKDETQPLPTGAFVAAPEWLKFGRWALAGMRGALAPCFTGTSANPHYGLGWWLDPLAAGPPCAHASGSGGQALYLVPSADAVIVKFGDSASYKHEAFLKRLLAEGAPL